MGITPILQVQSGSLLRVAIYLVCIPTTCGLPWVTESVEGAIDLSDDMGCTSRDALVGNIICTKR